MSSSSTSEPSGLMADPYASPSASLPPPPSMPSAPPSLPSGWAATPGLEGGSSTPDYLFETDTDPTFRRSWGERLTFHVGGAYLVGACLRLSPALGVARCSRAELIHPRWSPLSLPLDLMTECLLALWPSVRAVVA